MENKKYKLTDETIEVEGKALYRIEALKDFCEIKKGDKGGFIASENNLAHEGNAWVYDDAFVYDNALVTDDACVSDNACVYNDARLYDNSWVYDNACVSGAARVSDNARVCGNACVYGNACVSDNACVCGSTSVCGDAEISTDADYIVFKNWWSSGRYFTWTRSNNMWSVGCFYGTGEELIKKAYKDSELSGRQYERIVKYVEEINKENGK